MREAAVRGFVWTGGQTLFVRLLSLVSFVVLARLLDPRDFGLAALATVFSLLTQMLAAAGLGQALIQSRTTDKADLDTVFWMSTVAGLSFAVLMTLAAWPIAGLFGEPELRPLLQVLSFGLIFVGISSTSRAVLQRRLAFRDIAVPTISSNLVATAVGIGFAIGGLGAWAIVIQAVIAQCLTAVGLMIRSRYRPGRAFSWERGRELLATSTHYLGSILMTFLNQRGNDFLIGAVLGPVALGVYAVAYRMIFVLVDLLTVSVRRVAFPVFSHLQDDRARLREAYRTATRMSAVLTMPVFIFALVAAPEIVSVVFGEKWLRSVPVMQVLCLFGVLHGVNQFNAVVLQSIGRAATVFKITAAGAALQVIAFFIGVQFGLLGVAVAFVTRAYLIAPVGLVIASRELDSSIVSYLRDLLRPAVSTLVMVCLYTATRSLLEDHVTPFLELAVLTPVAALAYVTSLRLVGPKEFAETRSYVRTAIGREGASASTPSPA